MTKEQKREAARAKQTEQLSKAVEALRTTEGWKQWLRARKSFHRYSFRNQILISMQHPGATAVRGYHQWRKDFHRQVRKGSKAIWILAPTEKIVPEGTTGHNVRVRKDGKTVRFFFRSVKVFDVSDTDHIEGEEVVPLRPPATEELEGDSLAWAVPRLIEFIENDLERTFRWQAEGEGPEGYCSDTEIGCWEGPDNRVVRTLVHEISHALGVKSKTHGREVAETICDTIAWCVCDSLGFDTGGDSIPYIAGWNEASAETMKEFAETIHANATIIEEVIGSNPEADPAQGEEGLRPGREDRVGNGPIARDRDRPGAGEDRARKADRPARGVIRRQGEDKPGPAAPVLHRAAEEDTLPIEVVGSSEKAGAEV